MVFTELDPTEASMNISGLRSILTRATSTVLVRPCLSTSRTDCPATSSERYCVLPFGAKRYSATGPALTLKGRGFTCGLECTSPSTRNSPWEELPVRRPSPSCRISQVSTQTRAPVPMGRILVTFAKERETSSGCSSIRSRVLMISLSSCGWLGGDDGGWLAFVGHLSGVFFG